MAFYTLTFNSNLEDFPCNAGIYTSLDLARLRIIRDWENVKADCAEEGIPVTDIEIIRENPLEEIYRYYTDGECITWLIELAPLMN